VALFATIEMVVRKPDPFKNRPGAALARQQGGTVRRRAGHQIFCGGRG